VAVVPSLNGTIQIASTVIVVGCVSAYAADGTQFAFTARPADGSTGPDVYVWNTLDSLARPVTSDHDSLFASWVGTKLLLSRVVGGLPTTTLLDPATGVETPVPAGNAWRPATDPVAATAVWWDGTVARSSDGYGWVPGSGRLVLGAWPGGAAGQTVTSAPTDVAPTPTDAPTSSDAASPTDVPTATPTATSAQVASSAPTGSFGLEILASGALRDWQVRWDETGTALAVWVATGTAGMPGSLSLYAVNPVTGEANLASPLLNGAAAYEGFTLSGGRLTWSAPTSGGSSAVEVLAYAGSTIGQLELPFSPGTTLVR